MQLFLAVPSYFVFIHLLVFSLYPRIALFLRKKVEKPAGSRFYLLQTMSRGDASFFLFQATWRHVIASRTPLCLTQNMLFQGQGHTLEGTYICHCTRWSQVSLNVKAVFSFSIIDHIITRGHELLWKNKNGVCSRYFFLLLLVPVFVEKAWSATLLVF